MVMWNHHVPRQAIVAVRMRAYRAREERLHLMSILAVRSAIGYGKPREPIERDLVNGGFFMPERIARELRRMWKTE